MPADGESLPGDADKRFHRKMCTKTRCVAETSPILTTKEETQMLEINHLITIATLLVTLSIASERLVEVFKGLIPFLNQAHDNAEKEGWRKATLQTMAVIAGIITAILAAPMIADIVPSEWLKPKKDGEPEQIRPLFLLMLGLLASGGSGLWNSVLDYLLKVKASKQLDIDRKAAAPAAHRVGQLKS